MASSMVGQQQNMQPNIAMLWGFVSLEWPPANLVLTPQLGREWTKTTQASQVPHPVNQCSLCCHYRWEWTIEGADVHRTIDNKRPSNTLSQQFSQTEWCPDSQLQWSQDTDCTPTLHHPCGKENDTVQPQVGRQPTRLPSSNLPHNNFNKSVSRPASCPH